MRAAFYISQGPATDGLRIGKHPRPEPAHGEVLVQVHYSGINPSDWKARGGSRGIPMPFPLIVPHSDGAGVIVATGPGVPDRRGERVWLWNAQWRRAHGTAAEYVALPAEQAVPLPDGTSFAEGACLGIPAMTAYQAVSLADPLPDSTVLVAGGAGAVGHYAIQFAKRRGAIVVATVSNPTKAEHARRAGADHIIDYRREPVGDAVAAITDRRGVDAVIEVDLASNAATYPGLIRPHGRIVVYGNTGGEALLPALWLMRNSISVQPFLVYDLDARDRVAAVAGITKALGRGELIHTVGGVFPLDAIATAHMIGESGRTIGSLILALLDE